MTRRSHYLVNSLALAILLSASGALRPQMPYFEPLLPALSAPIAKPSKQTTKKADLQRLPPVGPTGSPAPSHAAIERARSNEEADLTSLPSIPVNHANAGGQTATNRHRAPAGTGVKRLPRAADDLVFAHSARQALSQSGGPRHQSIEPLPSPPTSDADQQGFPALPPDPYAKDKEPLPPLEEELWHHGGAHLYDPEGDRRNWPQPEEHEHYEVLRLPEDWQEPRPLTAFQDFLGADPIREWPRLRFPGCGYVWEPRFVGSGSYRLFGFALEENGQRQDAVGHQLIADLDLRLTGTERFHVQYRPIGREQTGGSYYQFSNPEGYVDNSTGMPDRYWFEAELHSLLGGFVNPLAVLDYHISVGRIPVALHNSLLLNDEFHGVVLNKNTIFLGPISNLNIQLIHGFNDVGVFPNDGKLYAINVSADYHNDFWEASYAFRDDDFGPTRDAHYLAVSRTKLCGPWTFAARSMYKWGDQGGTGDGQLFVLESNRVRVFDLKPLGVEKGVFFGNAFVARDGWTSIAGGNFNRLQTSFEVNPLVQIAAGRPAGDTWGAALGVQLFRHHEDESFIPEIAYECVDDQSVWGCGLRYLRKTSARTFFEALGVLNFCEDPRFERQGIFLSETILF